MSLCRVFLSFFLADINKRRPFSNSLLVLEETLEQANADLKRKLGARLLGAAVMLQKGRGHVAQCQMWQFEDSLAKAHNFEGRLDGRQAVELFVEWHAILRQE